MIFDKFLFGLPYFVNHNQNITILCNLQALFTIFSKFVSVAQLAFTIFSKIVLKFTMGYIRIEKGKRGGTI